MDFQFLGDADLLFPILSVVTAAVIAAAIGTLLARSQTMGKRSELKEAAVPPIEITRSQM